MGVYIIKAAPDLDLYMEWSTRSELPEFIGTRAQMLAYLHSATDDTPTDPPEARLNRADKTGTSALHNPATPRLQGPLDGAWDDDGLIVEHCGWLPRDQFVAFLRAYPTDQEKAYALLEPLDLGEEPPGQPGHRHHTDIGGEPFRQQ